jgi:hypothetical protein
MGMGDALVEIAHDTDGLRLAGKFGQNRIERFQIRSVIFPTFSISIARGDVSIRPRYAHTDYSNAVGNSTHESAARHFGAFCAFY